MPYLPVLLLCLCFQTGFSRDSAFIRVHFIYGSRPQRTCRKEEPRWVGGKMGGHIGIEWQPGRILDFVPQSRFHWFPRKKQKHSRFVEHTVEGFDAYFGPPNGPVKKVVITIPVSRQQYEQLDRIAATYLAEAPYDYAFLGMRCAAATYEILAQLGLVKPYGLRKTAWKIFYPKKLRSRLLRKAREESWPVERQEGSPRRRWDRD